MLPGRYPRQALQQLCGELAGTPLDPRHPLWEFQLVEPYEGGCALVARVHHCIGDGIALISVMMGIADGGDEPPRSRRARVAHRDDDWFTDSVIRPLAEIATRAVERKGAGSAGPSAGPRDATGLSGGRTALYAATSHPSAV